MTTATRSYTSAGPPDSVTELLARVTDGDPVAWDEILRRYGTLVSATVRSFRLQNADTLDAVQMTWLRLAENAHQVQYPERLGGWLATTARRECLRILRQVNPAPNPCHTAPDTVADRAMGPEQCVIDTGCWHAQTSGLPSPTTTSARSNSRDAGRRRGCRPPSRCGGGCPRTPAALGRECPR